MILVDATAIQSEHRSRGVGAYVREFISHTERAGIGRPWYFASCVKRDAGKHLLPRERSLYMCRPHRPAQVYWLYNEVALRAALIRLRPRLFFAPDFNGVVANPFGLTVAVLHDLSFLKLTDEAARRYSLSEALSELRWRAYCRKLRRADQLIARSESVKRDAVALLGVDPTRISVVAQGLDHDRFRPSFGTGAYRGSPPYFVHVGGRNSNKNQARIVEAFARLALEQPQAELYFAGPWRAEDLVWLQTACARWGLGHRARHIGYVPDHDLSSLYGNAVAVVFPSLEEGYGLPVLEGMASGAPVITSSTSSLPEVAGDAALLVDPRDVEAIASAMRTVLLSESQRAMLRERGYQRAATFSWHALTVQTWTLLTELLAEAAEKDRR